MSVCIVSDVRDVVMIMHTQVELNRKGRPYSKCVDPELDRSDVNLYEELYSATSYSANVRRLLLFPHMPLHYNLCK
jgi:hypothetical protein